MRFTILMHTHSFLRFSSFPLPSNNDISGGRVAYRYSACFHKFNSDYTNGLPGKHTSMSSKVGLCRHKLKYEYRP